MPPKRPNTYASHGPSQRSRRNQQPLSSDSEEDGDYDANANANGNRATQNRGRDDDEEVGTGGGGSTQGGSGGLRDSEIRIRAGQLARFALFQEYKKNLIRRTDIVKNVLPNNPRAYNLVFAAAQKILRDTVGCELVEVRARGKLGAAVEAVEATQAGGRKGKGRARQNGEAEEEEEEEGAPTQTQRAKSTSTKSYILRSILPSDLLAAMSNPKPLPLDQESEENADEDSGALIQWEKGDGTNSGHIALLGIRTVILAIVMTNGRAVSDDILHAYLRRLNLKRDTVLPYVSPDSKEPPLTLDKYLDLLARQNYLEKTKIPGHGNIDGSESCEWRWGQREVEFSEKDAAKFIEQVVLGNEDDEDSEDEEEQNNRRGRRGNNNQKVDKVARRKKLREDIAKAAGSELIGM